MQSPKPSVEAIFKKLDPEGTGMLSKQGVKEALSQMGMDSSAEAVEQIFRTASGDMTSPKSFSALVGKLKQQKASSENASMNLMKQRYDSEMAAERTKHQKELDSLQRQASMSPGARSPTSGAYGSSYQSPTSNNYTNGGYNSGSGGALVPISNTASPYRSQYGNNNSNQMESYGGGNAPGSVRKSPTSGYKLAARPSATKSSYGGRSSEPEPTGFMSPVTYNRKFNQLVSDMEQQTSLHVEDALREQRDRHADALERVVAEKEAEMALRLSELTREMERAHANELSEKLALAERQAEEKRLALLADETAKIDGLLSEAELYKIQSESEITDSTEKFKRILTTQLEEQRQSHSEELRRATLEAEARATELRVSIVAEKDKQFAAEKDSLETRLRAAAAADLELATKRFEAKLGEGLEAQAAALAEQAERERENALLEQQKAFAARMENAQSALKLQHTEALARTMGSSREEWEAEREKIRLSLAQEHADHLSEALEAAEAKARATLESSLERQYNEHKAATATALAHTSSDHEQRLRAHAAQLEQQHASRIEQALEAKEASHARILEQALAARDEEHQKMLDATMRQQEQHHVERTNLLLQQQLEAGRTRTEEILKGKNLDHDEHVIKIKSELAAGHHENLARELAHQREQLRKACEAEKHALTERLHEKRLGDLADQAAKHDAATAALTEELTTAHNEKVANLEAEWHERREEAVKVSARNLHDMHQEALRRALFNKDREMAEAIEHLQAEKDAHHMEVLQQLAHHRDEEHHDRLSSELEAQEAEHKAIMDQLVKEKLDADRHHRDEVHDLKEYVSQLESKMHLNKTSAQLDVRAHGDRLARFCEWVADQKAACTVETSLGLFKPATLQVLDSATGTASVRFDDGSEESEVLLSRIAFNHQAKAAPSSSMQLGGGGSGGAVANGGSSSGSAIQSPGGGGAVNLAATLGNMSSNERTLMVFLPLAVFPVVVVALGVVLNMAYAAPL